MRETWQMMRKIRIAPALLLCLVTLTLLGAPAWANPFETLPADHWAYDTVKTLSKKGFLQRFIEDRLHLGYRMTYFDVAMWLGEAFQRHQPDANGSLSLGQLVDAFNESSPTSALTQQERLELADLIALVRDPMEILGYPLPRDIDSPDRDGIRLDGVAKALEQFRMRGESRIVYQDVQSGDGPGRRTVPIWSNLTPCGSAGRCRLVSISVPYCEGRAGFQWTAATTRCFASAPMASIWACPDRGSPALVG